jgi:class 3 adenylate cyclase/predicted ATPase
MQQIADWLETLGMSEYAQRFAENRIDLSVLPDLTDQDLEKLGVLLGDRRKMLRAIAALGSDVVPPPQTFTAADPGRWDGAERRQVTVMFSDLVGSTALSVRMDPEDLREVISAYQKCVAETVRRFDGFVAKYLGDGVLVYFGYPQAHEDDAERAVRSGLELIAAVAGLKTRASLQTRVGIATGLVVVGDLIGSGEAQERGIVGGTPNLAARLQGIAEPNRVVIAEGTRRLLGDLFEFEDLGTRELKGIPGPVRAWTVLRASSVESRFEALHASGLTALVGREEESELLLRRWSRAKTGEGQVVLLSGEAGIGKSRLTAAFLERLATEPHTRLRYFCSPQHTDSALYPIIGQMQRAAGLAHDDKPRARLDKLDALLAQTSTSIQDAALFAEMLSVPNDGRYPALDLTPEQRRQKTLKALISQLEALTRRNPVLMIFEDAHWTDPTSLEVFGRTADRIATLRVLLIVTFRPEFNPPWIGHPHVTALTINRLAQREVSAMIDRVAGNKPLPASIRQDIIERTDGIPLFVEEMTKAVLEAESEGAARRTVAAVPSPVLAIPASLQASLMARLDRLGAAKEVAQIGAVIGREFSYKLLAELTGYDPAPLIRALRELETSGLIHTRGAPPDATGTFKHALVQEAAYSTLLRGRRQALHARIVDALEAGSSDMVETQPELVAQHCAAAGLVDRAVMYWGKAGQRAISRFALTEAIAHLTKALGLLRDLPPTEAHKQQELELQIALGDAFIAAKGYGAGETRQAFDRAHQLGCEIADAPRLFRALAGMFVHHHVRAEVDRAQKAAGELLRLAEEQEDIAGQVMGHRALGDSLLHVGHFPTARAHLERALSLFGPDASPVIVGEDIGVAALAFLALCLAALGFPAAALARSETALERARRRVRHLHTLAFALGVDCRLQWILRNARRLQESSSQLSSLAAEHGLMEVQVRGTAYRGCALALAERFDDAVSLLNEADAGLRATGTVWLLPFNRTALAIAYQRTGRLDRARAALDEALELGRQTRVEWMKAELQRLGADLALSAAVPNLDLAEASLRQAITTAQQQGAKWWELRAAPNLARLWRDQGKRTEARDLLAPVYGWFTEGFDMLDLKEAKALLDELAQ